MNKIIKFDPELADKIQMYANNNHNGNFSEAVRSLCNKAILLPVEKKES